MGERRQDLLTMIQTSKNKVITIFIPKTPSNQNLGQDSVSSQNLSQTSYINKLKEARIGLNYLIFGQLGTDSLLWDP